MRGVQLTKAAYRDLIELGQYTRERWGEEQARRYLTQLDTRFHSLARAPRQGRPCEEIKAGYWFCREGRHVIFYKPGTTKGVQIIRILHDRMLPRRHL